MNKVVCNLCGTSYPENATQCPICGQVRSAETPSDNSCSGTYTYVKGGRFSKANVKKRNRSSGAAAEPVVMNEGKEKNVKKNNIGLLVVMVVLLLAIIAVLGYIAAQFILPGNDGKNDIPMASAVQQNDTAKPTTETNVTEPSTEAAKDLACSAITLNPPQIQFDAIGDSVKLTAKTEPADTTDSIKFVSSDPAVITVAEDGTVSAVSEGSALITVTCGSVNATCFVTCEDMEAPEEEAEGISIALNRKEITFNQEGQSWLLYDGELSTDDIVWSSDDNEVATISAGKVVAVNNGDTTVYGSYNGQTVSCIIHCVFSETGESGGISEASGTSKQAYKLHNPYGYADDVTVFVGDQFPLQFVDENENEVAGAQWTITDESICTYVDGIVEATNIGTTEIVATYEGISYICTVRVIEQ